MSTVGLLLDSDVLAEIRKAHPDPHVVAFLRRRSYRTLYLSVLSLGELKGIFPSESTDQWLNELLERFKDHVLEIDAQVSLEWAGRHAERALHTVGSPVKAPVPTAALEGLMAATASVHELEIVSSKAEVYRTWDVPASNPFIED